MRSHRSGLQLSGDFSTKPWLQLEQTCFPQHDITTHASSQPFWFGRVSRQIGQLSASNCSSDSSWSGGCCCGCWPGCFYSVLGALSCAAAAAVAALGRGAALRLAISPGVWRWPAALRLGGEIRKADANAEVPDLPTPKSPKTKMKAGNLGC